MPFRSEHAARMKDPGQFKEFRRENDKMGMGVDVIWGIKDDGKTELQAVRFDKSKFTPEECQKWLKDHDMSPIEFEPAIETAEKDKDDTILLDQEPLQIIRGAEIFKTGTWKGKQFETKDLDEMVNNWREFKDSWFQPAVKDGHHFEPGKPALGYLDNVRRVGDKLIADLVDLPTKVYDMIKGKRYDRVSAEIAPNLEKNGKTYKWVLSALAILGPEIPEVTGLKPLRQCFQDESQKIDQYDLENGIIQITEWTAEYVTDLPDSAFAVVLDGGGKDEESKTTPRSLRKLPHHNSGVDSAIDNDSVDLPHLRNALARLPQASLSPEQKSVALHHLEAHAKALEVGENYKWDELYALFEQQRKKEDTKMADVDEKKLVELQTLVAQFETKIKDYETKIETYEKEMKGKANDAVPDKIKVLVNQLGETQAKLLNTMGTLKSSQDRIHELEEQGRKNRIQAKLDTLRVPAFRFYAGRFYDWATKGGEEVERYSQDGVIREKLREQVVDEFVEFINKATDNLFIQHSKVDVFKRDDVPGDENPRGEVDRRVSLYMKEHPTVDYSQAMTVVLNADPMLKEAYAKS